MLRGKFEGKRYKSYYIIAAFFAILFCFIFSLALRRNNVEYSNLASVEALRVKYPAYDVSPTHWRSALPELDLLLSKGGIMIVGEVIKSEPKILTAGEMPYTYTMVKVLDNIVSRERMGEVITVVQDPIDKKHDPPLTIGMKAIFLISKGTEAKEDPFWFSKYGSYYVTDEDYVVSFVSYDIYDKYSGLKLRDFKREMKKIMK